MVCYCCNFKTCLSNSIISCNNIITRCIQMCSCISDTIRMKYTNCFFGDSRSRKLLTTKKLWFFRVEEEEFTGFPALNPSLFRLNYYTIHLLITTLSTCIKIWQKWSLEMCLGVVSRGFLISPLGNSVMWVMFMEMGFHGYQARSLCHKNYCICKYQVFIIKLTLLIVAQCDCNGHRAMIFST